MHSGLGLVDEIFMEVGRAARILCPSNLIPAPGQYLLAHAPTETHHPLPHPVFLAASQPGEFCAAPPWPPSWTPGTQLALRGPLGRGFRLPVTARRVALVAFGGNSSRLLALLTPALAQQAEISLLTDQPPENLPPTVEILPLTALAEALGWADYSALDAPRAALPNLRISIYASRCTAAPATQAPDARLVLSGYTIEILVETPLPCGGVAECGVCAVHTRRGYQWACKDGPVFDLQSVI